MKVLCLICIFHCVPFSSNAEQSKADSLFSIGAYQQAAILYEKQAFLNQRLQPKKTALLYKSYCYKALGEHNIANSILKRAINLGSNDSLDYLLRYESVLNSYLEAKPEKVLSELNLIKFYFPQNKSPELLIINILALNDLSRWREGQNLLMEDSSVFNISKFDIEKIYKSANNLKLKKPEKAFAISLLLPGMGQVYAGHLFKGIFSLTIQSAAMYYGIYGLKNSLFFTAALPGVAAFNMFYMGGADYSKTLVNNRNIKLVNQINKDINLQLLSKLER